MDCLSLIFFQGLMEWLCIFIFLFYFYSIILVIWGTATISNDEIGKILFSQKKFGILTNIMMCLPVHKVLGVRTHDNGFFTSVCM